MEPNSRHVEFRTDRRGGKASIDPKFADYITLSGQGAVTIYYRCGPWDPDYAHITVVGELEKVRSRIVSRGGKARDLNPNASSVRPQK